MTKYKSINEVKVKDRVKCIKDYGNNIRVGDTGVVKVVENSIGVEWDRDVGGHRLWRDGKEEVECREGHGWWVFLENIEKTGKTEKTEKERIIEIIKNSKLVAHQDKTIKPGTKEEVAYIKGYNQAKEDIIGGINKL